MRPSLRMFLGILVCVGADNEGDSCTLNNGQRGVCTDILKCAESLRALQSGQLPKDITTKTGTGTTTEDEKSENPLCGFIGAEPLVCCNSGQPTATPAPRRPTTTTEYTPPDEEYQPVEQTGGCAPIRNFTARPGDNRISWRKCLQYQEELVYPCQFDPLHNRVRVNNCKHAANQLIFGGVDAEEAEFPHMVMLSYKKDIDSFEAGCGGSLVSDWYILTAAHCTYKKYVGEVQYAATSALRQSQLYRERIYKIAERLKYPRYVPNWHYYDIALLKTETRMTLNMFAVPACLDLGNDVSDSEALATGWGTVNYKGERADTLQKVILQKFPNEECPRYFTDDRRLPNGVNHDTQMCYGDTRESKDTCAGDSGGPLVVKLRAVKCMYSIIGVTSFGRQCGVVGRPGMYTRVRPFVPWIESVVWPDE